MIKTLQLIALLGMQYHSFSANNVPKFTAVYDSRKNAVLLKWEHTSSETGTYIIQRSADNRSWVDITLQGINLTLDVKSFYFEDRKSDAGENYYRLKFIYVNGKIEYSPGIIVINTAVNKNWIMYPVPVTDLLTLEYRGTEKIKGVIHVFIQQSSGRIITRLRSASLNKNIQIPVGNLGKGIYDIRIIVEGNMVWNQRFVK